MTGQILHKSINRLIVLSLIMLFSTTIIVGKLFYLQIIKGSYYAEKSQTERGGYVELSPRRGEILIQDYNSGEIFKLGTNTTLDTLFVDPYLIDDTKLIADTLSPLIFGLKEEQEKDKLRIEKELKNAPADATEETIKKIMTPRTEEELRDAHYKEVLQKINQKTRPSILLVQKPAPEIIEKIPKLSIAGIKVEDNQIIAYPNEIKNQKETAVKIANLVDIPAKKLTDILAGRNRYVVLKKKIDPDLSQKIKKLKDDKRFRGIGLEEHTYRFYPEGQLASQILGFLDNKGVGQYGVEEYFETALRGQKGLFQTQIDATGQQVTVGSDIIIKPAIRGSNITLTIDRSIQLAVERKLERYVKSTRSDNGQVIIMDPKTGKLIALAQYPSFNPNAYADALKLEKIELTEDEIKRLTEVDKGDHKEIYLYTNVDTHERIQIFSEKDETGKTTYRKYKNTIGPTVFKNISVTDPYEPGSVFKAIAMAAALDDGDVTPNTTYQENGPIKVDEFEIHNAENKYRGLQTMAQALAYSSNIGMSWVAKKIGRNLLYNYMERFGFMERTDIEFAGENEGKIEDFTQWADSELMTHAFGQGILITPLQLITAYAAIANQGILMQPHIVEKIEEADGKTINVEPRSVRRSINEKTANTLTAMLVNAVENGVARNAQVKSHFFAGKTGTAQTYKWGKPLTGPGTTIATFMGFGPISDPKFVMLVKMDRPRQSVWADATVAPLASEIATYLYQYYNIPPDK